jgi:hypothetical protein
VVENGLTRHISLFYHGVAVTQYSPAVFDAFVNQIKVSSSVGLLQDWNMNSLLGPGGAPLGSRQKRDLGREP